MLQPPPLYLPPAPLPLEPCPLAGSNPAPRRPGFTGQPGLRLAEPAAASGTPVSFLSLLALIRRSVDYW